MRYLLDTDIVSDAIRNPTGKAATRLLHSGIERVCTSIVVAAELRFGLARRPSPRLSQRLDELFGQIEVLALEAPADRIYGDVRTQLERLGQLIGPNDLLIAAHALALGCTLVTGNEREFSQVKTLRIENWLR